MFGGAALLGLGAFGALTVFLIALISRALPVWAAALIVTLVYGIGALILVRTGRNALDTAIPLVPEQTVQTVKEDIAWAKTHAKSGLK